MKEEARDAGSGAGKYWSEQRIKTIEDDIKRYYEKMGKKADDLWASLEQLEILVTGKNIPGITDEEGQAAAEEIREAIRKETGQHMY